LPHPVSKLTWDNALHLSPRTAAGLGIGTGDIVEVTHESIPDVRSSNPQATIIKYPSGTLPFLFTQQRGSGPFTDERVRQALSLAVDRDALLSLTYNGEGWWQNLVPTNLGKWWTDPKDPANLPSTRFFGTGDRKKDVAEAVALLKAAGYDESNKLPIKFYYTPNGYTEVYNQWAEATAGFLRETTVFQPQVVPASRTTASPSRCRRPSPTPTTSSSTSCTRRARATTPASTTRNWTR
jgi:ABC-type transport system substrate-binding protein